MLFVLSPAKSLDYTSPAPAIRSTTPAFMQQSAELVGILRKFSPPGLSSLMKISDSLACLNAQRFNDWSPRNSASNSRPAVLAFDGDVYDGLQARAMPAESLDYLQSHLRILSGLYGVLRPLDRMQPHRLEMSTRLANAHGLDLYSFWDKHITSKLNSAVSRKGERTLVNLASNEYFKAVKPALLSAITITPIFEDWQGGDYKVISFFAKRARGAMVRFAALHQHTDPEALQEFRCDGYRFDPAVSTTTRWHFRRKR